MPKTSGVLSVFLTKFSSVITLNCYCNSHLLFLYVIVLHYMLVLSLFILQLFTTTVTAPQATIYVYLVLLYNSVKLTFCWLLTIKKFYEF